MQSGEQVDLPRVQTGSPPQHLLVTLLADYCLSRSARMPSAAMVALSSEFGVTNVGARAALSRLSRRGVVEQTRQGRRTFYALSLDAARLLANGSRRLITFALEAEDWDGMWTVVAFSMPEERRDARHLLRSRLRWLGFAPLYDGVWVSPHATAAEAVTATEGLSLPSVTVLRTQEAGADMPGFRRPVDAWDIGEIAAVYATFRDRWTPVLKRLKRGRVTARDALVARTEMMDTYRRFPGLDPQLPMRMMPRGWPRERARQLFTEAYDLLGPLAEEHVRAVVADHAPELAGLISFHSTDDLLAGVSRG